MAAKLKALLIQFKSDNFIKCSTKFFPWHKEFHSTYEHISFKFPKYKATYIFLFTPASNTKVSWLEISAVRAWYKLSIGIVSREPCLEVIFLGSSVIQSSRHDGYDFIREIQRLIELLRMLYHLLEHLPWFLRLCDAKLFNLLELMDSENTPSIFAMSSSFLSKARWAATIFNWQSSFFYPFSSVHGRNWLFWSSNQIKILFVIIPRYLVKLIIKVT